MARASIPFPGRVSLDQITWMWKQVCHHRQPTTRAKVRYMNYSAQMYLPDGVNEV